MPRSSAVRAERVFRPRLEARDCPAAPTLSLMAMQTGEYTFHFTGHVQDEHPAGLTVSVTGATNGSAVTNSNGDFAFDATPKSLGQCYGSVTDDEALTA